MLAKSDEAQQAQDSQTRNQQFYDDKLALEIEECDKQKARADALADRLQDCEEELDHFKQEHADAQELLGTLKEQIRDKD